MGEENKNKEKSGASEIAEKAVDTAKDTKAAVKDGVSLAKNIETGNVAGVAKDAVNLLKNKTVRRQMLISILMQILTPILIITLIVGSLFAIFNSVGEAIQNAINSMTEWVQDNYMYGLIYYTEDQIDAVIESIKNLGIDVDSLHLMGEVDYNDPDIQQKEKEALRKYIVKFLVAQQRMQTLNPKPDGEHGFEGIDNWIIQNNIKTAIGMMGSSTGQTYTYGNVFVHRQGSGTTVDQAGQIVQDVITGGTLVPTSLNQLGYLKYETLLQYIEDGNAQVLNYFSVDENGDLVYAKKTTTTEIKENNRSKSNTTITKYELQSIDYKSAISQYTTSLQFFVYLTMVTQNPEFASAVADLAANGEIRIMIIDNINKSTETVKVEYTKHVKERKPEEVEEAQEEEDDSEDEEGTEEEVTEDTTIERTASTETEEEETDANYEEPTTESVTETTTTTIETTNPRVAIVYANTWFCKQTISYQRVENPEIADEPIIETIEDEEEPSTVDELQTYEWKTDQKKTITLTSKSVTYEESVHGEVIDKTGQKGDGDTSFIGLLDKEFKIPNTNTKETAADNFVSGAEWLCGLLQMDSNSQNLENVIRYILYKYTGNDYGVTNLDFSIFDAGELKEISENASNQKLTEYVHYFEGTPKINSSNTKYIVYDDGAGNATVGYGVDINNSGYADIIKKAGYSIEIGSEIDIDFIDNIEKQILERKINDVTSAVSGLNLKKYQIQALVSRAYNCGVYGAISVKRGSPELNFVDSYTKYWNKETDDLLKQKNNQANFSHSLYTNYMSKPTTSGDTYMAGLETRRKSEWTLFQTGYYDTLNEWYVDSKKILEAADKVHKDEQTWSYYDVKNSKLTVNNIDKALNNPNKVTCCATYVSCVIYDAGYATAEQMNSYNYNNAIELYKYFKGQGWEEINSYSKIEPGDIVFTGKGSIGHVQIYAGDGTWYNAGATQYIQAKAPQDQGDWPKENFYKALRPSPIN